MITIAWLFAKESIWPVLVKYWRPIAIAVGILLLFGYHKLEVNRAWHAGQAALKEEQRKEAEKRDANADAADRRVRECAADPNCLRKDDGNRRD